MRRTARQRGGRRRAPPAVLAGAIAVLLAGSLTVWRIAERGGAAAPTPAATISAPLPAPVPGVAAPAAAPTAPAPTETPAPDPGLPGPPPEGLDVIARQVSALRGLPYDTPLEGRAVAPAALAARYSELAFSELDLEQVAADEALLIALRLLPAEADLIAIVDALYREQVLGMYVPDEQRLYIGSDTPALSPYKQVTAAHEVVHALQDRAFGIERLRDLPEREADAALAVISALEGDATLMQQQWSARHQTAEEREAARTESLRQSGQALQRTPRYIRDGLFFPYTQGAQFVSALLEHGGWPAVDDALRSPPSSSAHIYHPDRYLAGESPVDVAVPTHPGLGWHRRAVYVFGEFDLRQLLLPLGDDTARRIGSGWAGGEMRSWQRPGHRRGDTGETAGAAETAVALEVVFRDPGAAADGCVTLHAWYRHVARGAVPRTGVDVAQGDRDWMAWTCTDAAVRIGLAPDEPTALRLAGQGT